MFDLSPNITYVWVGGFSSLPKKENEVYINIKTYKMLVILEFNEYGGNMYASTEGLIDYYGHANVCIYLIGIDKHMS